MNSQKKTSQYIAPFLTGMCMGIADLIPGVSGGTIAFISGIYEKLVSSIDNITNGFTQHLLKGQFKKFFETIHGGFLALVFGGILVSIFTFSQALHHLLSNYESLVRSFFVGIIVASAYIIGKKVSVINHRKAMIVGISIGVVISLAGGINLPDTYIGYIIGGVFASIAMILPGISGSYILLLLGMYESIIAHVSNLSALISSGKISMLMVHQESIISVISVALGACIGLLGFSKILTRMLQKHHDTIISLLVGLMLGTLPIIRPTHVESVVDITQTVVLIGLGGCLLIVLEKAAHQGASQKEETKKA